MKILITGSRDWRDADRIERLLRFLYLRGLSADGGANPEPLIIVHGAARGADTIADRWATSHKAEGLPIEIHRYPAQWQKYGGRAGPIRNQTMVREHAGADLCVGFKTRPVSRGTDHCLATARTAMIPTWEIVAGQTPPPPPHARLITPTIRALLA